MPAGHRRGIPRNSRNYFIGIVGQIEQKRSESHASRASRRRDNDAPDDLIARPIDMFARVARVTPARGLPTFDGAFSPSRLHRFPNAQTIPRQRRRGRRSNRTRHETRSSRFHWLFLTDATLDARALRARVHRRERNR